MKPFLGIDLTEDHKNEQMNGEEFLVSKPSLALTRSFEQFSEDAKDTIEKSKLPLPLQIVQWLCGITGLLLVGGIVKSLGGDDKISLRQAYQNASWLFWLCGALLFIWIVLTIISARKQKNLLKSEESKKAFRNLDNISNDIFSELSVPSDSVEADILSFFYKIKGDTIKICEKGLQPAPYFNPIFNCFADSQNLYLANLEGKYAFPLSSVKAIHTVKKRIQIADWNKEEDYDQKIYKPYRLSQDNSGCIHCKYYHILEINRNGEPWGIYFPPYELPVFEKLTGLKAEEPA